MSVFHINSLLKVDITVYYTHVKGYLSAGDTQQQCNLT